MLEVDRYHVINMFSTCYAPGRGVRYRVGEIRLEFRGEVGGRDKHCRSRNAGEVLVEKSNPKTEKAQGEVTRDYRTEILGNLKSGYHLEEKGSKNRAARKKKIEKA